MLSVIFKHWSNLLVQWCLTLSIIFHFFYHHDLNQLPLSALILTVSQSRKLTRNYKRFFCTCWFIQFLEDTITHLWSMIPFLGILAGAGRLFSSLRSSVVAATVSITARSTVMVGAPIPWRAGGTWKQIHRHINVWTTQWPQQMA